MHKDVMVLLARMGLKTREGKIYLACQQASHGLFVHELTRTTKITRSTIDLIVRRLVQRGFLNKVKIGRRWRYFAQPPETLLFQQKQLVEDWEQVVPLLAQHGEVRKETEILHFEGARGFRQVHDDVLLHIRYAPPAKKDVLAISSGADFIRLFPDVQRAFIRKRVRNGSWYKAIATQASARVPEWQGNAKELRQVKYVPDASFNFRIEMQIYADNVMLYSPVDPVGGVIIRNARIADSMRSVFMLIWNMLPAG